MNEPYQSVHKNEDSNSTIGSLAKYTAISLAMSGALEGGTLAGEKLTRNKHSGANAFFEKMAYSPGSDIKFLKPFTAGTSTKLGRISNYGVAVATGLISGVLASNKD